MRGCGCVPRQYYTLKIISIRTQRKTQPISFGRSNMYIESLCVNLLRNIDGKLFLILFCELHQNSTHSFSHLSKGDSFHTRMHIHIIIFRFPKMPTLCTTQPWSIIQFEVGGIDTGGRNCPGWVTVFVIWTICLCDIDIHFIYSFLWPTFLYVEITEWIDF